MANRIIAIYLSTESLLLTAHAENQSPQGAPSLIEHSLKVAAPHLVIWILLGIVAIVVGNLVVRWGVKLSDGQKYGSAEHRRAAIVLGVGTFISVAGIALVCSGIAEWIDR